MFDFYSLTLAVDENRNSAQTQLKVRKMSRNYAKFESMRKSKITSEIALIHELRLMLAQKS